MSKPTLHIIVLNFHFNNNKNLNYTNFLLKILVTLTELFRPLKFMASGYITLYLLHRLYIFHATHIYTTYIPFTYTLYTIVLITFIYIIRCSLRSLLKAYMCDLLAIFFPRFVPMPTHMRICIQSMLYNICDFVCPTVLILSVMVKSVHNKDSFILEKQNGTHLAWVMIVLMVSTWEI